MKTLASLRKQLRKAKQEIVSIENSHFHTLNGYASAEENTVDHEEEQETMSAIKKKMHDIQKQIQDLLQLVPVTPLRCDLRFHYDAFLDELSGRAEFGGGGG